MELLVRRSDRVGYFRPVIPSGDKPDTRIELMSDRYQLEPNVSYAYTSDEVASLLAEGRSDEVFRNILESFRMLAARCDFVLCDGSDYTGGAAALEFGFNTQVAAHLGAPVVVLVNGRGRDASDIVEAVRVARESLAEEGCSLVATMVNRADTADVERVLTLLETLPEHEPIAVIPEEPVLGMPTTAEVVAALNARPLAESPLSAERVVTTYKTAAMAIPHFLDHVVDGALVMTPGDRADVIISCVASRLASTYPSIAGLILTGGLVPEPQVQKLLDGLPDVALPVYSVDTDTYTTAHDVDDVVAVIRPSSRLKIATALGLFEQHVDTEALLDRIEVSRSERLTPLMFEFDLIERARAAGKHIVLPEGTDDRILQAAELLRRRDVVKLTLLGDPDEVNSRGATLGLKLDDVTVVDPQTSELRETFAVRYQELRAHRGVTLDLAREAMLDVSYFGTMMVHAGIVDGMVSGAAHTTQHTIRPAFEIIRTPPEVNIVSSVFLMCLADRVLVYGDCAVNPNPTAGQLADIAISSAATAAMFGIEPRVAMLSYSTGESGKGEDVERVREATQLARERRPDLEIDGPLQYDAAVDASVGKQKLPDSSVAGRATVFVFPDLNTGNNTYKAVQRSAGAVAIGPVLQGLNKPVNDLSRGCLVPDIVNTVAITAIQAQGRQEGR
jgi:phosphate acetyltransferase